MADHAPKLEDDLYALVVYLHASCNRDLLEAIGREQVPFSGLILLERLRGGHRRPTVRQAAAIMHVSAAGASRILDRLAREGLVRREADDEDYRARRILITDRGEGLVGRLHAARREQIRTFAEQLDVDERGDLAAALERLCRRDAIAALRPAELAA